MSPMASRLEQMMPRWVQCLVRDRHKASTPEDVDARWREMAENDLYGANTPDYTHVPKESAQSDHPLGRKPRR